MFDYLIRNGVIVDGTGAEKFRGDVGIREERIVSIGNLSSAQAVQEIDATGKIVAPGFVDVHNHSDGWMLKTTHLTAKTTQGFTTEVLMADGISYAPVNRETWREWVFYLRALDALRMDEYEGWESLADFNARLDRRNVQNSICHVAYANVRSLACGFGKTQVDDFQMRQIRDEIRRGMDAGAVGVSTGLDYIVQCFSTTDELSEACEVLKEYRGLYVTHMRYKKGIVEGLKEAVAICRHAEIPLHVSHLKAMSEQQTAAVFEYLETARKEVELSFDVYPYLPGSTMMSYLLPYEAWIDGPLGVISRLSRAGMQELFARGLDCHRLPLERIRIAWMAGAENRVHLGKSLARYIEEMNLPPVEALTNLLIEERLAVLLVYDEGDDRLAEPFLCHDLAILGTDGIYFPDGLVHPRVNGSAGRLLGSYVREKKLLSLESAVRKLSGYPAEKFGLIDRGVVREGAFADLVVFDPETICDRATYDEPHLSTVGVEHVLVNGIPILSDSQPVMIEGDVLPGRALRYRSE